MSDISEWACLCLLERLGLEQCRKRLGLRRLSRDGDLGFLFGIEAGVTASHPSHLLLLDDLIEGGPGFARHDLGTSLVMGGERLLRGGCEGRCNHLSLHVREGVHHGLYEVCSMRRGKNTGMEHDGSVKGWEKEGNGGG